MKEVHEKLKKGLLTPSQNLEIKIKKIKENEDKISAFISLDFEGSRKRAAEIESKKNKGMLYGLIIAVKDNIAVKGMKMTCASKMLENYYPPYNATVVEKIIKEDGIIIGKTNMDEFACGSDTTHSAFKITKNPVDLTRVPGGSSGGSAAAVKAGFCDLALGSDTGGSIRCPASFCKTYGFKPSYGAISRYGLADMAMSLDQIGVFSEDIFGVKLLFDVIKGEDERDAVTKNFEKNTEKGKIAIVKEFFEGCDKKIEESVKEKIKGLNFEEISIPSLKYALPTYYLLVYSEFASTMQKYDGLRYGSKAEGKDLTETFSNVRSNNFGMEVKRRILLGTYITSKDYKEAWYATTLKARSAIKKEVESKLNDFDFLIGPTMPMEPWKIGEKAEPTQMYSADILTVPINICGLSAISIPLENGGLQVIARQGDDDNLLKFIEGLNKK
jgi:aspartyl-tRNA(Asn)/glutamyl-tRNA(Gln) amidotransferase subunit A